MEEMNRENVERLANDFMEALKRHYVRRMTEIGPSREAAYEAINALALAAAVVIKPTGTEGKDFFVLAFEQQLDHGFEGLGNAG